MNNSISLTGQTVVQAAEGQMSCDLAGEAAILNLVTGVYYGLDPVGARIWELIQEPKSLNAVRDALLEEYEVDSEQVFNDLTKLLTDMNAQGLIKVVDSASGK